MPKAKRSPVEIEAVRKDIMEQALEIIVADGLDGFNMRKLASRLNITAKTIYNYFHNKDELYLQLLTRGFEQLLSSFERSVKPHKAPMEQLNAAIRAYVEFGLEHANLYNLMFTWHVPKYNDYVGTPMEPVAKDELTQALKCTDFFMARIAACLGNEMVVKERELRIEMIQIWSHMHGYVAGINNNLLDYMDDAPLSLKDQIIERIIVGSQRELVALRQRLKIKVVTKKKHQ